MPHFFPENIEELFYPKRARCKERSSAERQTYESLKQNLRGDYDVYYSVRWLRKGRHAAGRDGEADFVIVHPAYGFLILEVKGGGISRRNGRWFSSDSRGRRHPIKDPYEQAMQSKWALLKKIKAMPGMQEHWLDAGHAVIFPDCDRPEHGLGSDATPQITLFAGDLNRLGKGIDQIFKYWQEHQDKPGTQTSNGKVLRDALRQLLAPNFKLQFSLRQRLEGEEQEFIKLTREQYRVLDYLSRTPRVLVSGSAGSGKTTLAMEKARRLAKEGFATLLICLHPGLADDMRASLRKVKNLKIISLIDLMQSIQAIQDDAPRMIKEFSHATAPEELRARLQSIAVFLKDWLPENRENLCSSLMPDGLTEALVVDEGHFLGASIWEALVEILEDPQEDILYIFYDPDLFLFSTSIDDQIPLPGLVPITLQSNMRNTINIARLAAVFRSGSLDETDGPEGRPVEFHSLKDASNPMGRKQALNQIVQDLIQNRKIKPEDIALLNIHTSKDSCLAEAGQLAGLRLASERQAGGASLLHAGIFEYAGTERPVIILFEMDELIQDFCTQQDKFAGRLLYYAITRARSHLIWLADQSHIQWLEEEWLKINQKK